jgi:dihydrofolate synthase/folylpolyglutamate synthase
LRVGLFTSPHLVSFRERIQVNRQLVSENEVVRLVEELQPLLKQFPDGHHPTFFEVVTVMALKFFAEKKCDLVIWETGLGGRLDATNIVTPLASVITNIQFDHQQWLGDTLAKIAAEKAGIIKPGVPVITATDEPEALKVIEEVACEKKALLEIVTANDADSRLAGTLALPLPGEHQKLNAALALATVEVLQNKIPVGEENMRAGLQSVDWPGRLQWVTLPNGRHILLDGAHNVAGAKVLREALSSWSSSFSLSSYTLKCELQRAGLKTGTPLKFTLILGVLQDKDWRRICETLAPLASRIFTVPVSSERSANPDQLAAACRAANPPAEISVCDSLREALGKIPDNDLIVITGSLCLVGEALELLELSPVKTNERGLNEWRATPVS